MWCLSIKAKASCRPASPAISTTSWPDTNAQGISYSQPSQRRGHDQHFHPPQAAVVAHTARARTATSTPLVFKKSSADSRPSREATSGQGVGCTCLGLPESESSLVVLAALEGG